MAYHYEESRDTEKAVEYLIQAGEKAQRSSADEAAIAHFTRGLALLRTLADGLERTERELTLQLALGPSVTATKRYGSPEAGEIYERAMELCRHVDEAPQLFPTLYGLARFTGLRGDIQTGYELGEQLMHLAEIAQDPALVLEAHRILGAYLFHLGELIPARTHVEQCIALYDRQLHCAHAFLYGHDPAVSSLSYLAMTLWLLGYPDQALEKTHELLTFAQELSHPFSLAYAMAVAGGHVHLYRGDVQTTQERSVAAITLSIRHGFPFWLGMGTVNHGWALAEQGAAEEGAGRIRDGLDTLEAAGCMLWRPYYLALLAQVIGETGQAQEGLRLLTKAFTAMDATGERTHEAELLRIRGELLVVAGDAEPEAAACFERALAVAHNQSARSLELRAATSLARLWQRQGRREEAREQLQPIYGWFTEGFDTADLREAKELLDRLDH